MFQTVRPGGESPGQEGADKEGQKEGWGGWEQLDGAGPVWAGGAPRPYETGLLCTGGI